MADYGQFCPVAKATGILGERWTLLILRELGLGTSRFSDFQRALSRISPTVLTRRLNELEKAGIVIKKPLAGRKGSSYFLTPAGKELAPLIEHLATWGMRWATKQLSDDELDVNFLMWELQRRLKLDALPGGDLTLCFIFNEFDSHQSWWIVINNGEVDLCTENPGRDVDLYLRSSVRTLAEVWDGKLDLKAA